MTKYQRKPIEVEAERVEILLRAVRISWRDMPLWFTENYEAGNILVLNNAIQVHVSGAWMTATKGDYLVAANGFVWVVEEKAFGELYE